MPVLGQDPAANSRFPAFFYIYNVGGKNITKNKLIAKRKSPTSLSAVHSQPALRKNKFRLKAEFRLLLCLCSLNRILQVLPTSLPPSSFV